MPSGETLKILPSMPVATIRLPALSSTTSQTCVACRAGQRLDLLGQPQHAFAADHGLLELGLFEMALVVVLPDLHPGRVQIGRGGKKPYAKKSREDSKSCHEDETSKRFRERILSMLRAVASSVRGAGGWPAR